MRSRRQIAQAYIDVFTSPAGQIVLDELRVHERQSSFSTDPLTMAYNEGRREMARLILSKALAPTPEDEEPLDESGR